MAEPLVPEETTFKILTESVINLRMHRHGVLSRRDHLQRMNGDDSTRRNELRPRLGPEHSGRSRSEILLNLRYVPTITWLCIALPKLIGQCCPLEP